MTRHPHRAACPERPARSPSGAADEGPGPIVARPRSSERHLPHPRRPSGRQRPGTGCLLLACAALAWPQSVPAGSADALDFRGNIGFEFLRLPRFVGEIDGQRFTNPNQQRVNLALKGELDLKYQHDANWRAGANLFVRQDQHDDDRDELRLDEAWVQYASGDWDLRVGNQRVTWGSVESVSPLDVINPRDYEEDIVEPAKVGLTMARLRRRLDDASLEFYWLPGYQPSRYAGPESYYAIGGGLPNDYPRQRWSGNQWAARYFRSEDSFDLGLSFLHGLERNASFSFDPATDRLTGTTYLSNRLGTDVTYIAGDLVLKLEAVFRTSDQPGNRSALLYALGTEYTLSSIWRYSDLTLFVEYLASSHNVQDIELMQNDVFAALRWNLKDHWKQRLQFGTFQDLDHPNAYVWRIEHQLSPSEDLTLGARYTLSRNYYPGPRHVEPVTGVLQLFFRYNF